MGIQTLKTGIDSHEAVVGCSFLLLGICDEKCKLY